MQIFGYFTPVLLATTHTTRRPSKKQVTVLTPARGPNTQPFEEWWKEQQENAAEQVTAVEQSCSPQQQRLPPLPQGRVRVSFTLPQVVGQLHSPHAVQLFGTLATQLVVSVLSPGQSPKQPEHSRELRRNGEV